MILRGKVWQFGDDIDTDQIYPGKYLPLTDKQEMARHAMEGTENGPDFLNQVRNGDIIVAGKNFGCGSSREHAPVAIKGAGISVVIAESFARIFHRNCVNTGLPILILESTAGLGNGDVIALGDGVRTAGIAGRQSDGVDPWIVIGVARILQAGGVPIAKGPTPTGGAVA